MGLKVRTCVALQLRTRLINQTSFTDEAMPTALTARAHRTLLDTPLAMAQQNNLSACLSFDDWIQSHEGNTCRSFRSYSLTCCICALSRLAISFWPPAAIAWALAAGRFPIAWRETERASPSV